MKYNISAEEIWETRIRFPYLLTSTRKSYRHILSVPLYTSLVNLWQKRIRKTSLFILHHLILLISLIFENIKIIKIFIFLIYLHHVIEHKETLGKCVYFNSLYAREGAYISAIIYMNAYGKFSVDSSSGFTRSEYDIWYRLWMRNQSSGKTSVYRWIETNDGSRSNSWYSV